MKTLIALLALSVSSAAFAHDSTVPHIHPHGFSVLPDLGALAIAALLVAVAVVLITYRRKIK